MMISCPKCGFQQPKDQYCAKCGVNMDEFSPPKEKFSNKALKGGWVHFLIGGTIIVGASFYFLKYTEKQRQNNSASYQKPSYFRSTGVSAPQATAKPVAERTAKQMPAPQAAKTFDKPTSGSAPSAAQPTTVPQVSVQENLASSENRYQDQAEPRSRSYYGEAPGENPEAPLKPNEFKTVQLTYGKVSKAQLQELLDKAKPLDGSLRGGVVSTQVLSSLPLTESQRVKRPFAEGLSRFSFTENDPRMRFQVSAQVHEGADELPYTFLLDLEVTRPIQNFTPLKDSLSISLERKQAVVVSGFSPENNETFENEEFVLFIEFP